MRSPFADVGRLPQLVVHASATQRLGIYLNDHRAGSAAGLALARRCRDENAGTALGGDLASLVGDIEQERAAVDELCGRLGVLANPFKQALARVGEIGGRGKLNGQAVGYSPLSRVLEVELLMAAVTAKQRLWVTLDHLAVADDRIGDGWEALAARADEQLAVLQRHHRAALAEAFARA